MTATGTTLAAALIQGRVAQGCSVAFHFLTHPCLVLHSYNRAMLEQMMLLGHFLNAARSCDYVVPQHVLVNLAIPELDPSSSYSPDKPRGCSHTLCCSSKPQNLYSFLIRALPASQLGSFRGKVVGGAVSVLVSSLHLLPFHCLE